MQVFCFGKVNLFIFVSKRLAIRTTVRLLVRGKRSGGVRSYNKYLFTFF